MELYHFAYTLIKERSLSKPFKLIFIDHCWTALLRLKAQRDEKRITFFNDLWTILYIVIVYIGVKRFGVETSVKAFLALQVFDFFIKLIVTIGIISFKRIIKIP